MRMEELEVIIVYRVNKDKGAYSLI
jgi:hypothetical protein